MLEEENYVKSYRIFAVSYAFQKLPHTITEIVTWEKIHSDHHKFQYAVDSRYLEIEGTLKNTSRYP